MTGKKSIEDVLAGLRTEVPERSVQASPARDFEHLSDDSVLRLYNSIRRQVEADKALGEKYRLVGPAAKHRAEQLRVELAERGLKFTPIVW
jgi:hypothetical protein